MVGKWGKQTCNTAVSEQFLKAAKAISNWKMLSPEFLQIFWSDLLKTVYRDSANAL